MGDRHNRFYTMAAPDQYESPYALYDPSFQQHFSRTGPPHPPPHFDNMSYWYRPEPQETAFDHNKMLYNQSLPGMHSPIEQSMSAIKHRRTRSGCFTCRHRRVKCDETRPICDRCKKGNRECQFPPTSSSSRRTESGEVRGTQGRTSPSEVSDRLSQTLPTVDDDEEDVEEQLMSPVTTSSRLEASKTRVHAPKPIDANIKYPTRSDAGDERPNGTPSSAGTSSPLSRIGTPMSAASTPSITHRVTVKSSRWIHLSPAMQLYLQFHQEKVTRHHYFLKFDPTDFIHNELIDIALTFEPLLHAVVGFAAYHHALSRSDGRFQDFWKHYCQSIMLLRQWLEKNTDRNEAVVLTVLQLATFEEYLGDWTGVSSHLKAAYSIFSSLYTYENIMDNVTSRCIFDWLARGDVAISLMAGATTTLERQWFTTALQWHETQAEEDGSDSATALPCIVAKLRLLGYDIATVHATSMSNPNALKYINNISERMDDLRVQIQTLHKTTQSGRNAPLTNTNAATVDHRLLLFHGSLWSLNFIWIDWYSTEQMHKYRTMLYSRAMEVRAHTKQSTMSKSSLPSIPGLDDLPLELEKLSLIQCQIFEAIEKHPQAPPGVILGCQASLALACVFLQKTPKHNIWARRKLAKIERMGYVWAPSFRKRMSQLWNDDSVLEWWLPNDELRIHLLDEIRGVAEERNTEMNVRGGDEQQDLRDIKAVFDKLEFGQRGTRTRKDSVWSVAGTAPDTHAKIDTPENSDDGEEDDEASDDEEDKAKPDPKYHNRSESHDSGFGSTPTTNTRRAPPTILEYSNRMSGIWEG